MSLGVFVGAAVALTSGLLGSYVLLADPRKKANRLFFLFAFLFAVRSSVAVIDLVAGSSGTGASALGVVLGLAAVGAFAHFTLEFPRAKVSAGELPRPLGKLPQGILNWDRFILARAATKVAFLYGIPVSVGLFAALWPEGAGYGAIPSVWGPLVSGVVSGTPGFWVLGGVIFFYFVYSGGNLLSQYSLGSMAEKKQIGAIFWGVTITLSAYVATIAVGIAAGVPVVPIFLAFVAYAIVRHRLFVVPAAEEPAATKPKYRLEKDLCHLVCEDKPAFGFDAFADAVTHGSRGLILTRTPPAKIRQQYGLQKTPIVWVGEQPPSPDIPSADRADEIAYLCAKFLKEAGDGIVVFDSLEYLIQRAGFREALDLLYHLKELVAKHNARLILSVNPGGLEPKELSLLEKEFEHLGPDAQKRPR